MEKTDVEVGYCLVQQGKGESWQYSLFRHDN